MIIFTVTAAMVADELAKKGVEIDRKLITMRDIRKVGDYEAVVHFHKEVEIKVPVKVVAENKPVAAPVEVKAQPAKASEANEAVADDDETLSAE